MQEVREKDEAAARKADEKEKELEQMRQNQQRMWDNMQQMQNIIDSLWKQMKGIPQDMKNSFPESKIS